MFIKEKNMCCRCYVEYLKDEELRKMYNLVSDKEDIKTEGEIYPTDNMVVICKNKDNKIGCYKMKWGYTLGKTNVFNTRVESCEENIFKDGINNRRCVIPISNYFEWKKEDKSKYALKAVESVTYLLGVYRYEDNKPVFSIMTKEATPLMKEIHDRMPIAIKKELISEWLLNNDNRYKVIDLSLDRFIYNKCE